MSVATAALVLAPIVAVVSNVFLSSETTWSHLASTVLPDYVWNTLLLVLLVAAGVMFFGVLSAWLATAYAFPGQRLLEWALVLPLAMPAYVMAYAYTDWLQAAGPVQTVLREITGWRVREYWFPEIRSLPGAAAMLSFALYPYVYLLSRTAFLDQSRTTMEAARLAGYGSWGRFWHVALPLARTAIVAGTALALMETLADFGTVSYFAVNTFTTGIYRAWLSLGDPVAAGQLATCLLVFVLMMLSLERLHRGRALYAGQARADATAKFAWLACAGGLRLLHNAGPVRFLTAGRHFARARGQRTGSEIWPASLFARYQYFYVGGRRGCSGSVGSPAACLRGAERKKSSGPWRQPACHTGLRPTWRCARGGNSSTPRKDRQCDRHVDARAVWREDRFAPNRFDDRR